ncbi:taste receptor type 2 member 40-like [Falco rusticolus]|uniref:taste receptor type 2 member 40-like n=1 Tax=Falco cherrug TaxID=345164 RepID=UPI001886A8B1|nr:taste receptor type 2 member 40-like [Falco cherrug]XP_037243692.1 taste receptor type 2 member 40-like [Falco rusticolus]
MSMLLSLLFLAIAIIESMAGLLGNGTILVASSTSCIRSKILSSYDAIMIFLSLSRFFLQSWMMLDLFLSLFCETSYYEEHLFVILKTVFMFLNYSSFWSAAWLSAFYCIKIASFTQSFFIWLKQRISCLVPWVLITSSLFSFATSLPFAWDVYDVHDNFSAPSTMTNSSERRVTMKASFFLLIILCNAGIALPLIVFVVSSILLIRSLWIHTRQIQNSATGFRNPSLEAHIGAIKSVLSFLIFYVTYFISLVPILADVFLPLSIGEAMCIAVMAACPAGHSMVLIWSNPKFRELLARVLHHASCPVRTKSMEKTVG